MHRCYNLFAWKIGLRLAMLFLLLSAGYCSFSPVGYAKTLVVPNGIEQQKGMLTRFYYQAAVQISAQGGDTLSRELVGKIYGLNPDNFEIALFYASFFRSEGQNDEALLLYQKFLQQFEEPMAQAIIYHQMSAVYDSLGQYEKSIEPLKKAIQTVKEEPLFYYDLGVAYAKLEQFDKTALYSKKTLEKIPKSAEAWNNLGFSLAKMGQFEDGYAAVKRSLELDPKNANTLDSVGYILFMTGRFKESIIEYTKAIERDPSMAESFLFLGKAYEATGDWKKASKAYRKFMDLSSDNNREKALIKTKLDDFDLKELQSLKEEPSPLAFPLIPALSPINAPLTPTLFPDEEEGRTVIPLNVPE